MQRSLWAEMAHHPTLYMHGIREKQLLFGDARNQGRGFSLEGIDIETSVA
ncbi:MAG TPA: hypothetical protein VGF67_24175 [Ktedonobacteraceae bacterium]|jgi:hypothetical protein